MKTMKTMTPAYCCPIWKTPDTEFGDQTPDSFEGLSALFDLRRMGFIPQEEPDHAPYFPEQEQEVLS